MESDYLGVWLPSLVAFPLHVEHAVDGGNDHAQVGQRVPELGDEKAHLGRIIFWALLKCG